MPQLTDLLWRRRAPQTCETIPLQPVLLGTRVPKVEDSEWPWVSAEQGSQRYAHLCDLVRHQRKPWLQRSSVVAVLRTLGPDSVPCVSHRALLRNDRHKDEYSKMSAFYGHIHLSLLRA